MNRMRTEGTVTGNRRHENNNENASDHLNIGTRLNGAALKHRNAVAVEWGRAVPSAQQPESKIPCAQKRSSMYTEYTLRNTKDHSSTGTRSNGAARYPERNTRVAKSMCTELTYDTGQNNQVNRHCFPYGPIELDATTLVATEVSCH